jgi:hypothetical protein
MRKTSGYMDNPLRQNFFRAGYAHAGVIVILSLVCQILAPFAVGVVCTYRGTPLGDSDIGGILLDAASSGCAAQRSRRTIYAGAAILAISVATLAISLFKNLFPA